MKEPFVEPVIFSKEEFIKLIYENYPIIVEIIEKGLIIIDNSV